MNTSGDPSKIHPKVAWARRLVREKLADDLNALSSPEPPIFSFDNLPPDNPRSHVPLVGNAGIERKVCIVGAGVAGLYIALILDALKSAIPELRVTYDILEAHPSRAGGRLYTHSFSEKRHDYYDVGAMRYPRIKSMARAFDLFDKMKVKLIPYYLEDQKAPRLFNDRFFAPGHDPYRVSTKNGGFVPDDVVDVRSVDTILNAAFGPYKDALAQDFNTGFKKLMLVDDFSTREFLKRGGPHGEQPRYSPLAIDWMETQDTATNLFDQAFSESVMDSFDFDNPQPDVEWVCIEGGSSRLIDSMQHNLSTPVELGKRVEAISTDGDSMSVKCADETDWRAGYHAVFATTTLGCLGRMDLRGLNLNPGQKEAIRSLHYDDSAKVALKFTYPWWMVDCHLKKGGVGSTDLPLRTCVYPSYILGDSINEPAVLLASYTWSQDATRIGSLINQQKPPDREDEIVDLILHDLARLHAQHGMTYEKIKSAFVGYHAFSWSHDPRTAGAFALFGPAQFSSLYPYLTRPAAGGKFHFAGEAVSTHHAWVAGALDSAWTAVYRFLHHSELWDVTHKLKSNWGEVDELETEEFGTVHLQILLSMAEEEVRSKLKLWSSATTLPRQVSAL